MMQRFNALLALTLVTACAKSVDITDTFAARVAAAHGEEVYASEPIRSVLTVEFGGKTALQGTLTFDPSSGRSRIDLANGTVAVFDGEHAWVAPADAEFPRARFHLLTWSYFLAAPWKLGDPGTRVEERDRAELRGQPMETARITFADGIGDSPKDWYVAYAEPETHTLRALAYIVTYGKELAEAEKAPHAAVYEDYTSVGSRRFPTDLSIYDWSEANGIEGEPLGSARFAELRIGPVAEGTFTQPPNAREDVQ